MDISTMVQSLRDPMGIPFYPLLFQVLMVLTFALHILFVNFVIGSSFLAVFGYLKGGERWSRLSRSMARATTANVSMAMLLGVAPLLFVQVVYDPFWYASNMLSAAWVIGFIAIMVLGYDLAYVFYLKRDSVKGKRLAGAGLFALVFFLIAGVIMHTLSYQSLQPEKWLGWYIKGNSVDASGLSLHSFQLQRFLHFIVPSFALTGIFLMLYSWYFREREDFDKDYLDWVGRTGAGMAFNFTAIQALVGFWWLFTLPSGLSFFTNPLFLAGAGLGVFLLIFLNRAQKDPVKYALPAFIVAFVTIFAMSYAREALRMEYLKQFSYTIFDYTVKLDWGSTVLFLGTFLMGLSIIGYLLAVAFRSGRVTGEYTASPGMNRWGRISISLLILWLVVVAGLGIIITVKNYL